MPMKRNLLYLLLLFPIVVWAAVTTITSPGNWNDPGIWAAGNIADSISEDVDMNNNLGGPVIIQSAETYVISKMDMNNGNTLTIDVGGSLTIGSVADNQDFSTGNSSTLNVNGFLEVWGRLDLSDGMVLVVNSPGILLVHGDLRLGDDALVNIQGNVTILGDLDTDDRAAFNVDGALTIAGSADIGSGSSLSGSGIVNVSGGCTGPISFCSGGPLDIIDPVIANCPTDISVTITGLSCDEQVFWIVPTASDNVSVASFTSTHDRGDTFPLGTTTVTYTAIDPAGNIDTCTFNVTVNDMTSPIFDFCPTTVNVSVFDVASQTAIVSWQMPTASDNCGVPIVSSNFNSGDSFPPGLSKVVYTATDGSGNMDTCEFEVNVKGNKAPISSTHLVEAFTAVTQEICLRVTDPDGDRVDIDTVYNDLNGVIDRPSNIGDLCFNYTSFDDFIGQEVVFATVCDNGTPIACIDVEIRIRVTPDLTLTIYKAITPDGDNINDYWVIENIQNYDTRKIMIYDRLGGLVYSAENYNNEDIVWDGRSNQNGQNLVPSGTYYYKIDLGSNYPLLQGFIEVVN